MTEPQLARKPAELEQRGRDAKPLGRVGSTRIRPYEADDASATARLFYETVRSVNQADYSEEQVEAWAPAVPNKQA